MIAVVNCCSAGRAAKRRMSRRGGSRWSTALRTSVSKQYTVQSKFGSVEVRRGPILRTPPARIDLLDDLGKLLPVAKGPGSRRETSRRGRRSSSELGGWRHKSNRGPAAAQDQEPLSLLDSVEQLAESSLRFGNAEAVHLILFFCHAVSIMTERLSQGRDGHFIRQANISAWVALEPSTRRRGLDALRRDLEDGTWASVNRELADAETLDAGYRIVICTH